MTLIAMVGRRPGLIYEKYVGGVDAKTFDEFLRNAAPKIKAVYNDEPVVIVLDNARIHKGSKADGIDITRTVRELGFFHLFTIPHSPQPNAIEMVFSQLKSHVVSELIKHPERRKALGNAIDEAMSKVTTDNINNYWFSNPNVNNWNSNLNNVQPKLEHHETEPPFVYSLRA